jgi:hypothetical protein
MTHNAVARARTAAARAPEGCAAREVLMQFRTFAFFNLKITFL